MSGGKQLERETRNNTEILKAEDNTEELRNTIDNPKIKKFFEHLKQEDSYAFDDFKRLSDEGLVDKNLIKSIINDDKSRWFFDCLRRSLYLKHAEDIFEEACKYYITEGGAEEIIKKSIFVLYDDDNKEKDLVEKYIKKFLDLYKKIGDINKKPWASTNVYYVIYKIISSEKLKDCRFSKDFGEYLVNVFNNVDINKSEIRFLGNFILRNPEKFNNPESLFSSMKMSKFNNEYQLEYLEILLDGGFGGTLASKMFNNFSQDVRLSVIESLLQYGYGEDIIRNINSYKDVNRQKIVDMLYEYGYGEEVKNANIRGAKKKDE